MHLGTLGTGNHFIEVCLDERVHVWFMLHSGSRGVGNRIGNYFIELAKKDMSRHIHNLPDANLAYFKEGSEHFDDYVEAVHWAQAFARHNRELMMHAVLDAVRRLKGIPPFQTTTQAVNCHHNYVARKNHYGKSVFVTRKGAVRAGKDELGIIPGSMGARSYIVRGKGNPELLQLQPRRRPRDVAHAGQEALHARRSPGRPRASSAARTRTSSTRRRPLTRTSTR